MKTATHTALAAADLLRQASIHRHEGRLSEAQHLCREVLAAAPDWADAWHLLGVVQWEHKDPLAAEQCLAQAVSKDERNPVFLNALAVVLMETGRAAEAESKLRQALSLQPRSAEILCNLGRAVLMQQRHAEAQPLLEQALALAPRHAVCLANLAVLHHGRGQLPRALTYYRRALAIDPQRPKWWANLGAALVATAQYTSAADCFHRSLALAPGYSAAAKGLGVCGCAQGQYEKAAQVLEEYLRSKPDDAEACASLAVVYQHTGHWSGLAQLLPRMEHQTAAALERGEAPAEQPLFNLSRSDDPALNLTVARAWSRAIALRAQRATQPVARPWPLPASRQRITLGYLSADFRGHAVAHQAVSLFELHDRSRFRVCGFCVGPDAHDDYRQRIIAACDHFENLSQADADSAAQTIYGQGVDILIDLMGHTHQNRLDICALRPAPIQISFLGFLASSGADFIDYLIGDGVVTPDAHAPCYSEKIIRLPHCYQIISPAPAATRAFTRSEVGLPEDAFVFCCFNQLYKIDAALFDCWMRLLKAVPEAVLWLYRFSDGAVERLRTEARRQKIDPQRLIFGGKLPLGDHLARLRLADLALDTPRYNGGATTANALCAGVPVVAILGRHFVSRMSASHLATLGLNELIVADLDHYAQLAIRLARSPSALADVRRRLHEGLRASALLDTKGWVRHLEQAFEVVWQRHQTGEPPAPVTVRP